MTTGGVLRLRSNCRQYFIDDSNVPHQSDIGRRRQNVIALWHLFERKHNDDDV